MNKFSDQLNLMLFACQSFNLKCLKDKTYVGRSCIAKFTDNLIAKISFVEHPNLKDHFDRICVSVISIDKGLIDSIIIIFEDFLHDRQYIMHDIARPICFTPNLVPKWNGLEITDDGYIRIAEEVDAYLCHFAKVK